MTWRRLGVLAVIVLAAGDLMATRGRQAPIEDVAGVAIPIVVDYYDGRGEDETLIVPDVGEAFFLPRGQVARGRVRVRGQRQKREHGEAADRFITAEVEADGGPFAPGPEPLFVDRPENLGPQRTVVALADYTDRQQTAVTVETLRGAYRDYIEPYYAEVSEGRTEIVPEFYGPLALPLPHTCAFWDLVLATVAAIDPVVDFHTVDFLSIESPITCGYSGVAYLGRSPVPTADGSLTFGISSNATGLTPLRQLAGTPAHELGHNLWSHHSGFMNCGPDVSILPAPYFACDIVEYGGRQSVMGASGYMGHLDSSQKDYVGFWPPGYATDATVPGVYVIACQDVLTASPPKALRLARGAGEAGAFWVDCRSSVDNRFDTEAAALQPGTEMLTGVLLHVQDQRGGKDVLLDATPGLSPSWLSASLPVGQTWTDPVTGLSVRLLGRDATTATVEVVSLGTPDLTVPTFTWLNLTAGQHVSGIVDVRIRVTDNDPRAIELYGIPPWPTRWGTQFGPGPDYVFPIDTTTIPNGNHWLYLAISDAVNLVQSQGLHVVIDNPITTTTTSTSTTTTRVTTSTTWVTTSSTTTTTLEPPPCCDCWPPKAKRCRERCGTVRNCYER